MTHSLICADRYTDFKIAAVALISAILLVAVGLATRMGNHEAATAPSASRWPRCEGRAASDS